nr:hypothetical protein [Tanacetum cinerariifolium]
MNQNFYNSNSSGFDKFQPPQFPVIHQPPQETSIEILHDQENTINSMQTFLKKFNRISFFETPKVLLLAWDRVFKIKDALGNKQYKPEDTRELFRELLNDVQNIHKELAEYINTPSWNRPVFYDDDDDEDCTIAITPNFSITVENHIPIPSESEDECECDVPDGDGSQTKKISTFSNPLFDDSTSSDDESSHEDDIHEMSFKTYSNPLFDLDEEIISNGKTGTLNIKMMGDVSEQKVRYKQEPDKNGIKPDQIKKKREAWKSLEVSKTNYSQESRKSEEI